MSVKLNTYTLIDAQKQGLLSSYMPAVNITGRTCAKFYQIQVYLRILLNVYAWIVQVSVCVAE